MQELTVRLEMVYEQVRSAVSEPGSTRVIDVGSDHGYLALRCLDSSLVSSAVCTEIHKAPAKRSETALILAGYKERSEVFVTDGLNGVPLKEGDIVVIAGMGGLNIIDIVTRALKDNGSEVMKKVTFVLQPQKSNDTVRKFLAETGFTYQDESVCCDRDIFYNCMRVTYKGESYSLTDEEACYGPVLLERYNEGDKEVIAYFAHLDDIFEIRQRSNPVVKSALEARKKNERK
ncbi:tRNA (adenine(22)-N(1))-methyltransferase [Butyrivibrio sp. AE2032]|uniref:tRNA (adenine(22)-N(1))-methyltransferase n=1 Tax=Butyrivibrio sp. AE2032 TaxID=1458463 RepID=UPI0005584449|nr:class I SAM-dependent methyltransferase [Butyrivibrio sp. AE2032]